MHFIEGNGWSILSISLVFFFLHVQEIQATITELTKSRELMMQQRETFSQEAAEMEKALEEAESLLS